MKKILFLFVLLGGVFSAEAQVSTHIFESKDAFKMFPGLKQRESVTIPVKQMPPVKVDSLLKEDEANASQGVPFRFGYGMDVNYMMDDGIWEEQSSVRVWSMKVTSMGAYSINFIFSDMVLSSEAELYIYNPAGMAVYGPVTSAQNAAVFLTDLVAGDEVVIQLTEPVDAKERSSLKVSRVVHGYVNMFPFSTDARAILTCYNDVACYPEWLQESDGVALVLLGNGNSLCTGSLLNNTSGSFKPYILTAFHCIDGIDGSTRDGSISPSEQSGAENLAFRFRYKKEICGGSYVSSYFTYNQTQLRAAWFSSDFALMEIAGNNISRDPRVSYLGWNRTTSAPTSGTDIHHPAGEVMKISFDYNPLVSGSISDDTNWNSDLLYPANMHWKGILDNGSIEGGSSGSPLFDSGKRVVGQLVGGYSICNSPDGYYGRFDRSWSGGGTNATRLSNWLDPTNTGSVTTNTIKYPSVSGSSYFCTTTAYQIKYLPPGANVNIQVYPSPHVTASISNDTAIVLNANGNALTGWLYVNISEGSHTYLADTFRFITGDYYPDVQIYNDSDCSGEEYGRTPEEGNIDTFSGVSPRPSYDWCYNQLDHNKIRVYFYDERYRAILSSNLSYQVRLVRRSNQQVVYTYCCNYNGYSPLVIDYPGSPGVYYDVEMKLVGSDCPGAASWTAVGETHYISCAGSGGGGGIEEFRIERQAGEDFFTLKRLPRVGLSQSGTFTVRLYSLPLGRMVRETEVEIADATTIRLDGLPSGEYAVQIRRSTGDCIIDPPERIIVK
ncbi:MAG: hypothetical protein LBG96_09835 [Tannerella sp.]|jgi:hypothetical protein|nr:hypothetical protein [Tannerella sp.]